MKTKYTIPASILAIILGVVAVEGGYSNHPNDPGGATKYGITEAVARQDGYKGDMRDLTKEQAIDIYYKQYVLNPKYDSIYSLSPTVAEKVIDAGVNTGTGRSSKWLQTSINAFNGSNVKNISVDGVVGPATVNAYKELQKARGKVLACELVVKAIDAQQGSHYLSLTNLKQFTVGWFTHRVNNVSHERCKDE